LKMPATKTAFSSPPSLASTTPTFLGGPEGEALEENVYQKIRERAYVLFEQSGHAPGNEDANWLRAESECLHSELQVRESGTWLALTAFLPDASAHGIQIVVRPKSVFVRAREAGRAESSQRTDQIEGRIFAAANLGVEVDPSSAAASFRDHTLRLMIRKRRPAKFPP
jgi:HSP20 family molecular chaperone IbpA